jgi:uracil-DNA glycosylase
MNYSIFPSVGALEEVVYKDVHPDWLTPAVRKKMHDSLEPLYTAAKIKENNGNRVYFCPNPEHILEPFKYLSPRDTKVVILGQSPYPRLDDAVGIAFQAGIEGRAAVSVRNIRKSLLMHGHIEGKKMDGKVLRRDDGIPVDPSDDPHRFDLRPWLRQGVLLTNIVMTTEAGGGEEHDGYWPSTVQAFMELIPPTVVGLILGKKAEIAYSDMKCSAVIKHSHPADRRGDFPSVDVFGAVNEALKKVRLPTIDWSTMGG